MIFISTKQFKVILAGRMTPSEERIPPNCSQALVFVDFCWGPPQIEIH